MLQPLLLDMTLQRENAGELYDFRLFFDRACIRLAAERATDEHKRRAREAFEELCRARREELPRAEDFARGFYTAMLEATGNSYIIKTGLMIMELCRQHMANGGRAPDETALENYGKILEIFCSGDTAELDGAVERSLRVFEEDPMNG